MGRPVASSATVCAPALAGLSRSQTCEPEGDRLPSAETFKRSIRHFLAPIIHLLDDDSVTEILINGPGRVDFERKGVLCHAAGVAFASEAHLYSAVVNISEFVDRPLDADHPSLDARLPTGERVHVIIPPCARPGICVSIRKFPAEPYSLEELVGFGGLTGEAADFLKIAVLLHKSIATCGAAGSGKTSLLGALAAVIPETERVLVLEDASEIRLKSPRAVPLETRPPGPNGLGGKTIRDLFVDALRMRPDRIIIGECRRGEALDMVQAALAGHAGTLATWHAEGPREAALRLETLCLLGDVMLPAAQVRDQVSKAMKLVVCLRRDTLDGGRRVTSISEIDGLTPSGDYNIRDLFRFEAEGRDDNRRLLGALRPTGQLPTFADEPVRFGFDDHIGRASALFRDVAPKR